MCGATASVKGYIVMELVRGCSECWWCLIQTLAIGAQMPSKDSQEALRSRPEAHNRPQWPPGGFATSFAQQQSSRRGGLGGGWQPLGRRQTRGAF